MPRRDSTEPAEARRGFTLVELLVVVGIIAVLIAVLMPALGRAREHANRVKCAANLRAIGHALTMYVQHYGHYPGCSLANEVGTGICAIWPVRLRAELGGDQRVFYCPSQDERSEWTYSRTGPPPRASPYEAGFGYELGERLIEYRTFFSYGYNFWGASGSQGWIADGSHRGLGFVVSANPEITRRSGHLPASRVKAPERMIAIADSTADGVSDFAIFTGPGAGNLLPGRPGSGLPGTVHGGGANVLFCDGHVTWHLQNELTCENWSDPRSLEVRRMWNNDNRP